jgi:hypothetical protein
MTMAEKIKFSVWTDERGYVEAESREQYDEYSVAVTQEDKYSPFHGKHAVDLHIFVHEGSGIVVEDVQKFEAWLDKVVTR